MSADRHGADPNNWSSPLPVGQKQGASSGRSQWLAWWIPFPSWRVTPHSQANVKHLPGAKYRCRPPSFGWRSIRRGSHASRLSCGRLARRRKGDGRQSVPGRAQHSGSFRTIIARQLQALVRRLLSLPIHQGLPQRTSFVLALRIPRRHHSAHRGLRKEGQNRDACDCGDVLKDRAVALLHGVDLNSGNATPAPCVTIP